MAAKDKNSESDRILFEEREEIQQILGRPPGWILHWGVTIVFSVAVVFFLAGRLIRYPDVVEAKVVLTTDRPSIRVVARADGKISRLPVADRQQVQEGDLLAVLENPAKTEDVLALEEVLSTVNNSLPGRELPAKRRQLGELQPIYASLNQKIQDYRYFLGQTGPEQKIAALERQKDRLHDLNKLLDQQGATLRREVEIARNLFRRNEELMRIGAATTEDVEAAETIYLGYLRQLEQLQAEIINNGVRLQELEVQIIDLKQNRAELRSAKELAIGEEIDRLRSAIQTWKQTYLLVAPIAGQVAMSQIWSPQQYVRNNQEILTIVPGEEAGEYLGKALLPARGAGKVEPGMPAVIRLESYPYREFGAVNAIVRSISPVPEGGFYQVELTLPRKIETTYGKAIPFGQELQGTARIITEERSILERIFDRILSALRN